MGKAALSCIGPDRIRTLVSMATDSSYRVIMWKILTTLALSFLIGSSSTRILTKCFGVGVSYRNLYSFVVYLYLNGSGSLTSVGEERTNLSAVVYL